jgi:hypothetical protein
MSWGLLTFREAEYLFYELFEVKMLSQKSSWKSRLEKYINDPRGESCLVAGKVLGRALHIVCGMRGSRLLIVTVYIPKKPTRIDDKTRAKEVKSRV